MTSWPQDSGIGSWTAKKAVPSTSPPGELKSRKKASGIANMATDFPWWDDHGTRDSVRFFLHLHYEEVDIGMIPAGWEALGLSGPKKKNGIWCAISQAEKKHVLQRHKSLFRQKFKPSEWVAWMQFFSSAALMCSCDHCWYCCHPQPWIVESIRLLLWIFWML